MEHQASQPPLGVYIHFPWCLRKCPYCDFASFEPSGDAPGADGIDHRGYADALLAEIERRAADFAHHRVETVFFGGGTPSLWRPAELGRVLAGVRAAAGELAADLEVTVECNPSSLDRERAERLREVGVDRLSIGVQSLDAARLVFLGRLHDPEQALAAVAAAVAVMPRVSADLMFGVAGDRGEPQSPDEAADEAARVAELGIRHLSAYALTIEPNTRFGELSRRGRLPLVDEAQVADSFLAVGVALAARGCEHYEISNYAQPGQASRHNLGYWRGHDYLGLGAAAYGALATTAGHALRYRNPPNPERYLAMMASGRLEPHETDALDPDTRLRERLMLGLRLSEGVDLRAAADELGVDPWPPARRRRADELVACGRLIIEGGRLRIPPEARLFTDGTAAALF